MVAKQELSALRPKGDAFWFLFFNSPDCWYSEL